MMTEEKIEDRKDELMAQVVTLEIQLETHYKSLNNGNTLIAPQIYKGEQKIRTLQFTIKELERILRG